VHQFCHCSVFLALYPYSHSDHIRHGLRTSRYLLNYMTNATLDSDKLRLFLQIHLFLYFGKKNAVRQFFYFTPFSRYPIVVVATILSHCYNSGETKVECHASSDTQPNQPYCSLTQRASKPAAPICRTLTRTTLF
jgi:hypothetical protein